MGRSRGGREHGARDVQSCQEYSLFVGFVPKGVVVNLERVTFGFFICHMLPADSERVEHADEIVLCGTERSRRLLAANANNPYTCTTW